MGIQYLNSFIKKSVTKEAIKKIKLNSLFGKIIVVDTSIYLYRFLADEALMENMYIMLALFRYYNITPIFVFDGKAPIEKAKILEKRNCDKINAEKEYNLIKSNIEYFNIGEDNEELVERMQILKKKFIRIKRDDIIKVQQLMDAFGVTYIEADQEADEICAKFVIKKIAYACLSEDMDLFVYGCSRVLRYLSLINETVVIYYLDQILHDVNIPFKEFKEICVISGTDYNFSIDNRTNLYKTLKYYKLYKLNNDTNQDFYSWLDINSDYVENIFKLYNIYNMFITDNIELNRFKIKTKKPDQNRIKELMEPEGFIFV
uniref:XPG N-terminal domain-containing protein n=1 Tax=viral metagenome TaxID=1070528 RepID=A0A6C0AZK3_9ZZZZ|tara:strand:+ start:4747 stop:5697 length:951 start_codon:yes stop_codon:yes gene_type:complete